MNNTRQKAKAPTIAPRVVRKSITNTARDIADWKNAKRLAQMAQNPKFYLLQDIFNEMTDDGLLSSQTENRFGQTIAAPFELFAEGGKVDDKLTELLTNIPVVSDIIKSILYGRLFGYSVIELSVENGRQSLYEVPRQNIDPVNGRFYPDATQSIYINYRKAAEYNKYLLDFCTGTLGILNKTVPHVLFKKFAQSCWSELCEIYGIPPRYVKTNTTDEAMLTRAENMLKEMGAAAAFVIDTTEDFQFAQGVSTNGDVYSNLIRLCNNEISLLISGAVLGQDTENGNYSKEESSIKMLDRIIDSDRRYVENCMNATVIPALMAIGWLPQSSVKFRFSAVESDEKTWEVVKSLLPYKDIDNKWLEEKYGIPVKDRDYGTTLEDKNSFFV
jgi:Mu-like prophage protein gp29